MADPRAADLAIAALARRMRHADPATLNNFAWFAARRGALDVARDAARTAVASPAAPLAAWRSLERLAAGNAERMLLIAESGRSTPPRFGNPLVAGVTAHREHKDEIAEACYRAALADAACCAAAWNGLGVLHFQRHERAAASLAWDRAMRGGNLAACHNHALGLIISGDLAMARGFLRDLSETVAAASTAFLRGYASMLDGFPHEATLQLQAAVAREPSLARGFFTLAIACEADGRMSEAVDAIRRALLINPRYAPHVWLIDDGAQLQELTIDDAELASSPRTDDALLSFGRALLRVTHLGESLAVFEQVLARRPTEPIALFHRGAVLAKLRRYGEALNDWEQLSASDDRSDLGGASRRHARSARQLASLFASP